MFYLRRNNLEDSVSELFFFILLGCTHEECVKACSVSRNPGQHKLSCRCWVHRAWLISAETTERLTTEALCSNEHVCISVEDKQQTEAVTLFYPQTHWCVLGGRVDGMSCRLLQYDPKGDQMQTAPPCIKILYVLEHICTIQVLKNYIL